VKDAFRAYNNIYESVEDHGRFLRENARYAAAFNHTNNPDEFARAIHRAGYATDPAYSTKLINIMKKYDLYRFDLNQ
jgi:flagellum-specific peptidoglycan hydrolase FlgJ